MTHSHSGSSCYNVETSNPAAQHTAFAQRSDSAQPSGSTLYNVQSSNPTVQQTAFDQRSDSQPSGSGFSNTNAPSRSTFCTSCNVQTGNLIAHQRTQKHKANNCLQADIDGVYQLQTVMKNRISSYRIPSTSDSIDYEEFLSSIECKIRQILQSHLDKFRTIKVNMELYGMYFLATSDEYSTKSFNSKNEIVTLSTQLEDLILHFQDVLVTKAKEFNENKSGKLNLSHCKFDLFR